MHAEIYTHAAPFVDAVFFGPPLGFLMQRVVHTCTWISQSSVLNVVLYLNADQSRSEAERDANGNTALELLILFQEGQNFI